MTINGNRINANELKDYAEQIETTYCREYGKGKNKKITVTGKASYRVYDHDQLVIETGFADTAIEEYEKI